MSANHVCILLLIRHYCFNDFCFSYPTEIGHFRITYVGGNRVVDVPTIPDLHLLGESCIFKHRIPGECSSVVSTIQFLTHKFDSTFLTLCIALGCRLNVEHAVPTRAWKSKVADNYKVG